MCFLRSDVVVVVCVTVVVVVGVVGGRVASGFTEIKMKLFRVIKWNIFHFLAAVSSNGIRTPHFVVVDESSTNKPRPLRSNISSLKLANLYYILMLKFEYLFKT